ncbi:hypothetical protein VIN01S_22950 [Vibrio inusitatus NBRC 102082]|uniref:HTH crp-type domain-containing protein n=1 Tax=Vibrio inusitatus NBRC 102082 TaxID=1219070 RepID=A0A4Y3HWZ2_9VIBR|nr:helix-turn-helix domain-containing protein [Vibrio inusitatus]GEA51491.1 hypothetical protein VIN01S_22950 [Vibrio inusitatus NBRC 102082]
MNSKIAWPCELPDSLTQALIASSIPLQGSDSLLQFAHQVLSGSTESINKGIAYISQGALSISFDSNHTQCSCAIIIGKNTWIDTEILSVSLQMGAIIEEIEPIEWLWFTESNILRLCSHEPLCYKLLHFYKLAFRKYWLRSQQISQHSKFIRVAYILLELSETITVKQGAVPLIVLSQDQLALMTGLSRPRVNEVLNEFRDEGVITLSRGRVYIDNKQQLIEKMPDGITFYQL